MWNCHGTHARLETPSLALSVDLAQPHQGIEQVVVQWEAHPYTLGAARLLGLRFAPESRSVLGNLADSWVRGEDLIGVYAPSAERLLQPEVYWRALDATALRRAGIELIVSVQTELLDATIAMSVCTDLPAPELLWLPDPARLESVRPWAHAVGDAAVGPVQGAGLTLWRPDRAPFTYVEMIYPNDFCSATVTRHDGGTTQHWRLFPESLEKGVIRRARLRGVIVPRDGDVAAAASEFQTFAESALPLTT